MKNIGKMIMLSLMCVSLLFAGCAGGGRNVVASMPEKAPAAPTIAPVAVPATAVAADKTEVIYFNFDKSAIEGSEKAKVDKVAGWMKADAKAKAIVIGYTDPIGDEKYNLALSKERAEAVKAALVKAGVPAEKISLEYKGETNLVVKGKKTIKENAPNRRAEVTVTVK